MNVQLEVFFAKIEKKHITYLTRKLDISKQSENPDVYVDSLVEKEAEKLKIDKDRCIIHSTSWRCAHCDLIALTYLVYSDFIDLNGQKVKKISLSGLTVSHGTATQPTPKHLEEENILAHALRHLSLLIKSNPETYEKALTPESFEDFKNIGFALAGNIVQS